MLSSLEVLENYRIFRKVNLTHAIGLFYTPWKYEKTVFRGYRKIPLAWNGLISCVHRLLSMKIVFELTVRQIKYFDILQHCKMQKQVIFIWHRKTSSAHLHQIQCSLLVWLLFIYSVTLSWWRFLSYKTQSIDLQNKSVDWFLYDRNLCHERVKANSHYCRWSPYPMKISERQRFSGVFRRHRNRPYQGGRNVSFSVNFAYVRNEWFHILISETLIGCFLNDRKRMR